MKAVLIVFFRLFLVRVELNESKHLALQKPPHFLKHIKILHLLKGISCNHDYSAFKKIRFMGVCVEKKNAKTIRAQTAPVGWLIP